MVLAVWNFPSKDSGSSCLHTRRSMYQSGIPSSSILGLPISTTAMFLLVLCYVHLSEPILAVGLLYSQYQLYRLYLPYQFPIFIGIQLPQDRSSPSIHLLSCWSQQSIDCIFPAILQIAQSMVLIFALSLALPSYQYPSNLLEAAVAIPHNAFSSVGCYTVALWRGILGIDAQPLFTKKAHYTLVFVGFHVWEFCCIASQPNIIILGGAFIIKYYASISFKIHLQCVCVCMFIFVINSCKIYNR